MKNRQFDSLRPTLWRTCRALANVWRLRILQELFRRPAQPVTEVAAHLKLPVSVASRYLRDLNARGLLNAQRTGRSVVYAPFANPSVSQAGPLLSALQQTFREQRDPVRGIFRLATAFTHPRRVTIIAALASGPLHTAELGRRAAISRSALKRHLKKLKARNLLEATPDGFAPTQPSSPLAAALLALARNSA